MKKVIVIIIVLIIASIVIIKIANSYIPVKDAVNLEDISEQSYIIVELAKSTGINALAIADENGEYKKPFYIWIEGNYPSGFNLRIEFAANNKFVCYGRFIGYEKITEDSENTIMNYEATEWDILYPIDRNSVLPSFLLPKKYLCNGDF